MDSKILGLLNTLKESCHEAISGLWDKSNDGFEAMIEIIEELEELTQS